MVPGFLEGTDLVFQWDIGTFNGSGGVDETTASENKMLKTCSMEIKPHSEDRRCDQQEKNVGFL